MLPDRETLEATKMPLLKQMIVQMKGDPSTPGETKANLINRILYEAAKETNPEDLLQKQPGQDEDYRGPKEQVACTVEEVKKAVSNFMFRGMKFFHNPEDNTWLFRVRIKDATIRDTNTGSIAVVERWRDDSGTMNQPLSTIKRCASILMQNAPNPTAIKNLQQPNPAEKYTEVA